MTELVFPDDLLNEVSNRLRERGFVVLVAHSGGSKTALATFLEQQQRRLKLNVDRREVKPSPLPHAPGPHDSWPPGDAIKHANFRLTNPTRIPEVLILDNIHLDALAFHDFWVKWRVTPHELRPFVVATTRPHFLQALVAEREYSRKAQSPEEWADESFESGLRELKAGSGFINMEAWREELFWMHAVSVFGDHSADYVEVLWDACEGSHAGLKLASDNKARLGEPAKWSADGLATALQEAIFDKTLVIQVFPGTSAEKVLGRERFLELLAYRTFEASVEGRIAIDDLLDAVDLAQVEGQTVFSPLHPGHARLLLDAARSRAARGDMTLPEWVGPGATYVDPVVRALMAAPASAALRLTRFATANLRGPEIESFVTYLVNAISSDTFGTLSERDEFALAATSILSRENEDGRYGLIAEVGRATVTRVAQTLFALACDETAPSQTRAEARMYAVSALTQPVVFAGIPDKDQPAVVTWFLALLQRRVRHIGVHPEDAESNEARRKAALALNNPVVFALIQDKDKRGAAASIIPVLQRELEMLKALQKELADLGFE